MNLAHRRMSRYKGVDNFRHEGTSMAKFRVKLGLRNASDQDVKILAINVSYPHERQPIFPRRMGGYGHRAQRPLPKTLILSIENGHTAQLVLSVDANFHAAERNHEN
jgi:hypothetical protein